MIIWGSQKCQEFHLFSSNIFDAKHSILQHNNILLCMLYITGKVVQNLV